MFRLAQHSVLVGISMLLLCARASAGPLRIERVTPACVVAARELGPRIEAVLAGALQSQVEASVAIDAWGAGYRVTIGLRDTAHERGATTLETPTCEEAVDAAVVVLALAYGETRSPEATQPMLSLPMPERSSEPEPEPRTPSDTLLTRPDPRAVRDHTPVNGTERQTRLTLATGVDRGTLPGPTLTLAGAVARSFGGFELAAVARYGLPVAEELVETGFSESQRHDFGGLELRACRGLGRAVRVSACAGTEIGAVRARRSQRVEDGSELDVDHISPRVSGTLTALVARRGGFIEPGLELAGAAVAVGRPGGAPWLAVRVAAGAAIAF